MKYQEALGRGKKEILERVEINPKDYWIEAAINTLAAELVEAIKEEVVPEKAIRFPQTDRWSEVDTENIGFNNCRTEVLTRFTHLPEKKV